MARLLMSAQMATLLMSAQMVRLVAACWLHAHVEDTCLLADHCYELWKKFTVRHVVLQVVVFWCSIVIGYPVYCHHLSVRYDGIL